MPSKLKHKGADQLRGDAGQCDKTAQRQVKRGGTSAILQIMWHLSSVCSLPDPIPFWKVHPGCSEHRRKATHLLGSLLLFHLRRAGRNAPKTSIKEFALLTSHMPSGAEDRRTETDR